MLPPLSKECQVWKREKEELRKQLDEISSSNKALDPGVGSQGLKKRPWQQENLHSNGGFKGEIIYT